MQKSIKIDGKNVNFKFTLASFYIFKNQFGYDAMTKIVPTIGEIMSNLDFTALATKNPKVNDFYGAIGNTLESVYGFEITDILNLLWAFAKNGDPSIGDPISFYSEFEEFPLIDVCKELMPSLVESLASKKKLTPKNTEQKNQKKTEKQK